MILLLSGQEWFLVGVAFITSTIAGTLGMLGGITLLSVMTPFYPPAILIPLHGVVQLGSNLSRVAVNWEYLWFKKVGVPFLFGAILGAGVGARYVVALPEDVFRLLLGIFILVLTWIPKPTDQLQIKSTTKFFFLGGFGTFISLFVGATGPFLAPFFLHEKMTKHEIVANKALVQTMVHTLKVITFFALGFAFSEYSVFLTAMLISTVLGSVVGKKLLGKLPERFFKLIFRVIITLLAGRMIVLGIIK